MNARLKLMLNCSIYLTLYQIVCCLALSGIHVILSYFCARLVAHILLLISYFFIPGFTTTLAHRREPGNEAKHLHILVYYHL